MPIVPAPSWVRLLGVVTCALLLGWLLDLHAAGVAARTLPQVTAVALGAGTFALLLSLTRVAVACFAVSGSLAYVLLQSTTLPPAAALELNTSSGRSLSVDQYSTANLVDGDQFDVSAILDSPADVVSIQGLTPDWARALSDALRPAYPAQYLFPDIGVTGLGIFSKRALGSVDSVVLNGVVQVKACYNSDNTNEDIDIFAVQTLPPLSRGAALGLQAQLDEVSAEVLADPNPVILLGDLNAVPWSPEINRFTSRTGLRDSRRSQLPSYEAGMPGLFDTPVEHIFYTEHLRCVRFETLRTASAAYLGNRASFRSTTAAAEVVAR